jgi:hypothetical protein
MVVLQHILFRLYRVVRWALIPDVGLVMVPRLLCHGHHNQQTLIWQTFTWVVPWNSSLHQHSWYQGATSAMHVGCSKWDLYNTWGVWTHLLSLILMCWCMCSCLWRTIWAFVVTCATSKSSLSQAVYIWEMLEHYTPETFILCTSLQKHF